MATIDEPITLQVPTARVFLPLLGPARYKGVRGGRGGGKSYMVAERMIEDCATEHHRVACLREFQTSMADSVKETLETKIRALGVSGLFSSTDTEIRGPFESLIVFKGLRTSLSGRGSSAFALRSLEGFSRAWVEEAQQISQRSLTTMTPTFRRTPEMTGEPEMYFTWNPSAPTDPIERLFRDNDGDPDFVLVRCNYYDNPWFPDDLRRDMERDRRRDPDRYAHVWLGEYEKSSEARVFRNWRVEAFETPPDARLRFGADWGYSNDPTVLIRCWTRGKTLFVDEELYRVGVEIMDLPAFFDGIPGSRKWPIVADSARPETISHMQRHGFPHMRKSVKGRGSVEDGIEFLKSYDIVVHPRCTHAIDELSRYSWKIDPLTEEILPVLEDANNHVVDSLRYGCESERRAPGPIVVSDRALAASRIPSPRVTMQRRYL